MNIGIKSIGSFIPEFKIDNIKKAQSFNKNEEFLIDKIGAIKLPRKADSDDTSDLASLAIQELLNNSKFTTRGESTSWLCRPLKPCAWLHQCTGGIAPHFPMCRRSDILHPQPIHNVGGARDALG